MSKSKKGRTPQIDPRVLTRPRLDALFERHGRGELSDDGLYAEVRTLIADVGEHSVIDSLVKRMEGTPEGERAALMMVVERLKSPGVVSYLWQQVKKPGALSLDAKLTALVVLKTMGEDVDMQDPSRYFSPREIKATDLRSAEKMFSMGWRGMARSLRGARDAADVEATMHLINSMPENSVDGNGVIFSMIEDALREGSDLEADFLYALAQTTPDQKVRKSAEQALDKLARRGIQPVTPAILALGQDRFYAAYVSDPGNPWQQSVIVAWERAGGVIQALMFLLDFGRPWNGAIKDVFPTAGLTPAEFQRELIDKTNRGLQQEGTRGLLRVRLAHAQQIITAAVEANRKNRVPLPKDFNEFNHLIERWVLHPPAGAIESDTTRDEVENMPARDALGAGPFALDENEVAELLGPEEFNNLDEILSDVSDAYGELYRKWWDVKWVSDYLTGLKPNSRKLKRGDAALLEIAERWDGLLTFSFYVDNYFAAEVHELADLRGFHITDYVDEAASGIDEDGGYARVAGLRDFFTWLAQKGLIGVNILLLAELDQMLAQPGELASLSRPAPQGGEIAAWVPEIGPDRHDEPVTYNEWWMALVLDGEFKSKWDKARHEAARVPDGAAKLALLDRLQALIDQLADDDFISMLLDVRTPSPEDYKRAKWWFRKESISTARAW
jgi:hypothetical protein